MEIEGLEPVDETTFTIRGKYAPKAKELIVKFQKMDNKIVRIKAKYQSRSEMMRLYDSLKNLVNKLGLEGKIKVSQKQGEIYLIKKEEFKI